MRVLDGLSFDDVLLVPKHGHLRKREAADLRTHLVSDVMLDIPIVSAPMDSVTEFDMAYAMHREGGTGIIHRFSSIDEQVKNFVLAFVGPQTWWGAAIGVNEGYDRWDALYNVGCRVFCLDIAHADHETVKDFLLNAPAELRGTYIIAGNVATAEGVLFLARLGVDCVKVGIGPGAACSTRQVTGFGVPQLSAIMWARAALDNSTGLDSVTIMADGGIKNSGDIVKALAAGADTVMLGRLLAGANESPHPGLYWGMASKRVNNHHAPEGVEGTVPHTGSLHDTLKPLLWGVRSGISYGGGTTIKDLQDNVEFIRVSSLAQMESGTRV
jgi:IMP dehydrogenase